MARKSDLVVRGTIGEPRPGLVAIRSDGTSGRVQTDIVPIAVSSILKNGRRLETDASGQPRPKHVEVEISCAFQPPGRDEKLASLAGRQVVAYLVGPKTLRTNPGKVRYMSGPPAPRFQEAAVEGLLMELASGDGVRNLSLGEEFPAAELEDFYPDEPKFPPRRRP